MCNTTCTLAWTSRGKRRISMKNVEKLNITRSLELFEEAKKLVPGGVLGARKPSDFIEGEYPIFIEYGKGCRITDVDGNEYIDFLCGYGPIILGYREKEVDEAVTRQIRDKGFCFTLTQRYQNQLAKKLIELVPSSEMSIFLKTGSDATTASIRIARAYTNRIKVIRCGYHGWHDWCVEMKGGIPEKFFEDVYEFGYNHLDQLEDLMARYGDQTAAIIMTPFGHHLHQRMEEPKPGFLEGVREIATKYGAILVFDEVRTCFRLRMGGAQELYGVTPDLTVLGKGMANGYAISVVTGKADVMMAAAQKLFISSTFFPNSDGYIAALKTIEILERDHVLDKIWEKGGRFLKKVQGIISKYDVGAELSGVPPMFFITFKRDDANTYRARRDDFYIQLIRRGIFFTPHHHGYICHRHTEKDLDLTAKAIDEALAYVNQKYQTN
jgi:glutamate-1-semialdehyde aminotransferase